MGSTPYHDLSPWIEYFALRALQSCFKNHTCQNEPSWPWNWRQKKDLRAAQWWAKAKNWYSNWDSGLLKRESCKDSQPIKGIRWSPLFGFVLCRCEPIIRHFTGILKWKLVAANLLLQLDTHRWRIKVVMIFEKLKQTELLYHPLWQSCRIGSFTNIGKKKTNVVLLLFSTFVCLRDFSGKKLVLKSSKRLSVSLLNTKEYLPTKSTYTFIT